MIRVIAVMDSTGPGGAETSMAAMAPFMREHGIELEVAYFVDRVGVKDQLLGAGIRLWHVPPGKTRLHTMWHLRRLIKERRPDVVHTMVYEADIIGRPAAYLAKVPVVSSIINEMYGQEQINLARSRWKVHLGHFADIATAKLVSEFHAISEAVADSMASRLCVRRERIRVIYRGRDFTEVGWRSDDRRIRVRQDLGVAGDQPLLLAVGRHEVQKGFDLLLAAIKHTVVEWPNAILLIAGREGAVTGALEDSIERLGLANNVRLLGHRSDVPDLLAAADVMVFPSRWEGLGGAYLESLAMGCPTVCSDLPVLREVALRMKVQDRVAFHSVGNVSALSSALLGVLREVLACKDRSEIGGDVRAFSAESVAALHSRQYFDLAHKKRNVSAPFLIRIQLLRYAIQRSCKR